MSLVNNSDVIEVYAVDLEAINTALRAAKNYLEALDISEAARFAVDPIAWSPLTTHISGVVDKVDGILKDYVYEKYRESEEKTEDAEPREPVSD